MKRDDAKVGCVKRTNLQIRWLDPKRPIRLANSESACQGLVIDDLILAQVVEAWPDLPVEIRAAILTLAGTG